MVGTACLWWQSRSSSRSGTSSPPDRLARIDDRDGSSPTRIDKKYALRFIAVLALAACCTGLVGSVIWIIGGL
jgi:hypothetical protein